MLDQKDVKLVRIKSDKISISRALSHKKNISPIKWCHRHTPFSLSLAGISEQTGCVSSGSLWAHVELLEQRLQAPPVLRLHPLLPYWGRYEHGVERESEKGNEEKGNAKKEKRPVRLCILATAGWWWWRCCTAEADEEEEWVDCFYILFGWMGLRHRWFGSFPHQTPTPKAKLTPALDYLTVRATFQSGLVVGAVCLGTFCLLRYSTCKEGLCVTGN